ncbi:MAG: SIS domain-containing protein [Hungatella sp.]|jgi:D-sedoheptulose 7-phosphate isomerase|nr:SIS domain-containing protein [Hungatella sp.]
MSETAYLEELISRYPVLEPIKVSVMEAYEILKECFETGHKLLLAGNGGSAADSEHIVGELMKGFVKRRQVPEDMAGKMERIDEKAGKELALKLQGGLPAIALSGHPALSTAFLNDVEGEMIYAQQVYGYGQEGDVLLGISTSGNAANIHYAAVTAKAKGMKVIGLTGRDGGKMAGYSDAAVIVPEQETFKIQELHLPIYHALCLMLEEHFF